MKEKYTKLLSEILLAISLGVLLSIFILMFYKIANFTLFSASFFLTGVILVCGIYSLKFLRKYQFSLKIIELVGIAISLCITLLYAHTISLSLATEIELLKMMFCLHLFLLLVTGIHLYFFGRNKK